jgi:voltage-gated sodium channel
VCVLDAQFKQTNTAQFDSFVVKINLIFTAVFAVELLINLFANWPMKFFRNGWNLLDLIIVAMSLVDLGGPLNIPEWLVRLMRAFRIVRLFGRVPELTKMITAITTSLFPMMNAFIILVIVLSICEYN